MSFSMSHRFELALFLPPTNVMTLTGTYIALVLLVKSDHQQAFLLLTISIAAFAALSFVLRAYSVQHKATLVLT
jgi:hypothetical protein